MIKDDSGLLIGPNTPASLILAETAHLNDSFNHDKNDKGEKEEPIKLMVNQIANTVTVQSAYKYNQKDIFNFTNNGIYAAQKGI